MEMFSVCHHHASVRGEKSPGALRLWLDNGRKILLKKIHE